MLENLPPFYLGPLGALFGLGQLSGQQMQRQREPSVDWFRIATIAVIAVVLFGAASFIRSWRSK